MKSIVRPSLIFVAASLFAGAAFADAVEKSRVVADTPDKFALTVKEVHDEMESGGRYEFIAANDRAKVDADMGAMQAMLDKAGAVAAMKQDEKVRLFNLQEHLNGLLTHNDRNRLVCENRAPVGSHIPITHCRTYGEVVTERQQDQKWMDDVTARRRNPDAGGH
ncbi:MAG TPA: hypothetical protein VFB32_07840 [Rudaea sp.]|nr:hypothetical protein [Rudaea sp.]